MTSSSAPNFFAGWIGYGFSFTAFQLIEPTDGSYLRRPIMYGPLEGCEAADISVGSIGPAGSTWTISFVGLFNAVSGGNLLAVLPLYRPETISAGATLTDYRRFGFKLSGYASAASSTASWIAGAELGQTTDGLSVIACQNLQVLNGTLNAIAPGPSSLSIGSLPAVSPTAGSGELWNNGGVICVA